MGIVEMYRLERKQVKRVEELQDCLKCGMLTLQPCELFNIKENLRLLYLKYM